MPMTVQQLEASQLFKDLKYKKSQIPGWFIGEPLAEYYMNETSFLCLGVQAVDNLDIEVLRILGPRPLHSYPAELCDMLTGLILRFLCDFLYGPGSNTDEQLMQDLGDKINNTMQESVTLGGRANVLVGGCEISFVGNPAGDVLGFQIETSRALDWKASLP